MVKLDDEHLLFIEPKLTASTKPINDDLSKRLAEYLKNKRPGDAVYAGYHRCVCGVQSTNRNYFVKIGGKEYKTNSLALHYIQHHRNEVPQTEIGKIS